MIAESGFCVALSAIANKTLGSKERLGVLFFAFIAEGFVFCECFFRVVVINLI